MPSKPRFLWSLATLAAVMAIASIGTPVLESIAPKLVVTTTTNSTTTVETPTSFTNATHLAAVCLAQCAAGGTCLQDSLTAVTTCLTCGTGTSLNPLTGFCANTLECTLWPWCNTTEASTLTTAHIALVETAFFGPGPLNFTYPMTNLSKSLPFVPYLGANTTDVTDLLNTFLTGRNTLGPASGASPYFDDSAGFWGSSLAVYKSIVPSVYASYIYALKSRCCTRTWRALNGTCLPPAA